MKDFKKCPKCKLDLLTTDFYKNSAHHSGLTSYCKKCCPRQKTGYYAQLPEYKKEEIRQKRKDKYHNSPDEQIKLKEASKRWAQNNRERVLCSSAYSRAKKFGYPCNIFPSDIIIPDYCPLLGVKLQMDLNKCNDFSPSLDKINPKLGYVKGNIAVISHMANKIKTNASPEQLLEFSKNIKNYLDTYYVEM